MRYFLFYFSLFTLIACSQPAKPIISKDTLPHLEEKQWQLNMLNQQVIPLSSKPFFIIKGFSVQGNGGCNSFTGNVRVNGSTIAFTNIISLLMACDALETEKGFMEVLGATNKYRQISDTLFLFKDQHPLAMLLGTK